MTKQLQFLLWLGSKDRVKTHEIINWGLVNYYNRADRTKRDFIEQGFLTPLSDFQKECDGLDTNEGVYKVNHEYIKDYLQPELFQSKGARYGFIR